MHCIVYLSTLVGDETDEMLEDILLTARQCNLQDGITGLLLYHNRSFLQILEGSEAVVTGCFDRIKADPRHTNILELRSEEIEAQHFKGWHMAFLPFDYLNVDHQRGFLNIQTLYFSDKMNELRSDTRSSMYVKTFMDSLYALDISAEGPVASSSHV